jgi:hypothetical protein
MILYNYNNAHVLLSHYVQEQNIINILNHLILNIIISVIYFFYSAIAIFVIFMRCFFIFIAFYWRVIIILLRLIRFIVFYMANLFMEEGDLK